MPHQAPDEKGRVTVKQIIGSEENRPLARRVSLAESKAKVLLMMSVSTRADPQRTSG